MNSNQSSLARLQTAIRQCFQRRSDCYVLAIDGGGSKTEVLCAKADGTVVGRGLSGPTSLGATTIGAASFNLKEAVRQALETLPAVREFPALVMGVAGMDTPKEHELVAKTFTGVLSEYLIHSSVFVNDSEIALENGTQAADAVVLISGTGSICFGRTAAGAQARTGGLDYLLTDQGSGYYIGRQVLREAVKSFDGRGQKSILEEMVCQHFSIDSIADLKAEVYNPPLSKIEIAELSVLASEALELGDEGAEKIFQHALEELELMMTTVVGKLGLAEAAFDCVFSGSVLKLPFLETRLEERLRKRYPQIVVKVPTTAPVYGALKLALGVV